MKFQFYYEKLTHSKEYKKFIKENPTAYPCSALFILDKENKEKQENKIHFDFFIPKEEKIFSFDLSDGVKLIPIENIEKAIPEKLEMEYTFDLEDYEKLILKEIKKKEIKGNLQKLLFSLQKKNKKNYLITTGFLSNLKLLKIKIDLEKKKIESFENKSFFDLIRIVKNKNKKD
jgi:hypothetical protein